MSLLILAGWAASFAVHAAAPPPASNSHPDMAVAKAQIEEVLEAVDEGYRFDAYIVRWQGARVLVSAPLSDAHLQVGEELTFYALKFQAFGQHLLEFLKLDAAELPPSPPTDLGFGREQTTIAVQEVLQVEDGGYQQTAYVGQWHGGRVALACPLACGSHNVGDQMSVVVARTAAGATKRLSFGVVPQAAEVESAANVAGIQQKMTQESGIIEEVITSKPDGVSYAAYIVQWKGTRIGIPATSLPATHHVGESLLLQVLRAKMPPPLSVGLLAFAVDGPAQAPDLSAATKMNMTAATGVVESVLSAQEESYRYRGYVVTLNGAKVVVQDFLGTTHYNPGDSITFSQMKLGAQSMFIVLDFSSLLEQVMGQKTNQSTNQGANQSAHKSVAH